MGFQHVNEGIVNPATSVMNTDPVPGMVSAVMAVSSGPMIKASNGADTYYASSWDHIVSLDHSETFGGSSMVCHNEFGNSIYPALLDNQGTSRSSFVQYPSSSNHAELVPKPPCFGTRNYSEGVSPSGLIDHSPIKTSGFPPNYAQNMSGNERRQIAGEQSQDICKIPGAMGASPDGKKRKRAPSLDSLHELNKQNAEDKQQNDLSQGNSEVVKPQDDNKQVSERNSGSNMCSKQKGKQSTDSSHSGEAPKESYIHVRARKGQATNSHSLAERVRREKISERMRLLQELVPGCNKITGKAVMLDEIINYVQSLQQQVEFLSMKLATVNPELNINFDQILSKDILHSRVGSSTFHGHGPRINSIHPYQLGNFQGSFHGIPNMTPQFNSLPQVALDEFQSLIPMNFYPGSGIDSLGPNGHMKLEI